MISNRLLYSVEGQYRGMPFELLAIGVVVDGGYVTFHDTVRQRGFEGHVEKETPDGFVWHRECSTLEGFDLDEMYVFRVLTVKEYDRRVRPKVSGDPPRFRSDAELHEYYRRRFLGPFVVDWELLQEAEASKEGTRQKRASASDRRTITVAPPRAFVEQGNDSHCVPGRLTRVSDSRPGTTFPVPLAFRGP